MNVCYCQAQAVYLTRQLEYIRTISMARILILYSTTDGHTGKICRRLQERLQQQGQQVEIRNIADGPPDSLDTYEKIVIGASIRYGKHQPVVLDFIRRNRELLERRGNAFFSVNIVARKPEKNQPETNPYMKSFLRISKWRPDRLEVFAGRLEYPRYGILDRSVIRFIMLITGGPTARDTVIEYTDWERVDNFADEIAAM